MKNKEEYTHMKNVYQKERLVMVTRVHYCHGNLKIAVINLQISGINLNSPQRRINPLLKLKFNS